MIHFQEPERKHGTGDEAELTYFGSSAFRITAPSGLTIMIDPWRNHPAGTLNWYYREFCEAAVDIGVSTHAHFDHDALHRLDSNMLIDRLVGRFELADVRIIGVADKHVHVSQHSLYDWARLTEERTGLKLSPPNNPRSFDNSIVLVETAGLRILHWGDNRPDPPLSVWEALGDIDVALLPVDQSQHILSYSQADSIAERLGARIIVPHHYFVWNLTQRCSTLLPVEEWVNRHERVTRTQSASYKLVRERVKAMSPTILFFGEHVALDPNT